MTNKSEKHQFVIEAEKKVKEELTTRVYSMIGPEQRLILIQDELPKVPLYSTARIRQILESNNGR